MKKIILLVVIAALSSMHLCGQTTPPAGTPYMEFNVARNSSFQFKLMGHSKIPTYGYQLLQQTTHTKPFRMTGVITKLLVQEDSL